MTSTAIWRPSWILASAATGRENSMPSGVGPSSTPWSSVRCTGCRSSQGPVHTNAQRNRMSLSCSDHVTTMRVGAWPPCCGPVTVNVLDRLHIALFQSRDPFSGERAGTDCWYNHEALCNPLDRTRPDDGLVPLPHRDGRPTTGSRPGALAVPAGLGRRGSVQGGKPAASRFPANGPSGGGGYAPSRQHHSLV